MLILVLTERPPKDLDITLMTNNSSDGSWDVFIDWYNHLLSHQYFWEAQRILQTLPHDTGLVEYRNLVRKFLKTIDDQESAKIAGSALIQSFLYRSEIGRSDPLAVVRWNDAISWALFGMTFAEAGDEPTSLFSCVSLRRSVQETFGLKLPLPSDGVNNTDGMSDWLFDAIQNGDEQAMRQWMLSEKRDWNELRGDALLVAASKNPDKIRSFLDYSTVNARDAFQRTPLHWASLTGQTKAVELLLDQREVDAGLHDWFGSSPLHYAIRHSASTSTTDGTEDYTGVASVLLKSRPADVNMADSRGLTPLRIAILRLSYDMSKLLLQHGAIISRDDYFNLPAIFSNGTGNPYRWKQLLDKYSRHQDPSSLVQSNVDVYPPTPSSQRVSSQIVRHLTYSQLSRIDTTAVVLIRNLPLETTEVSLLAVLPFQNGFCGAAFRQENGFICAIVRFGSPRKAEDVCKFLDGAPINAGERLLNVVEIRRSFKERMFKGPESDLSDWYQTIALPEWMDQNSANDTSDLATERANSPEKTKPPESAKSPLLRLLQWPALILKRLRMFRGRNPPCNTLVVHSSLSQSHLKGELSIKLYRAHVRKYMVFREDVGEDVFEEESDAATSLIAFRHTDDATKALKSFHEHPPEGIELGFAKRSMYRPDLLR